MQKFNRLVTGVLPYLQPHVQSCVFTKKNHFRVLGLFNNMQKLPYLQSHVQGCGLCVVIKAECGSCSAVYFIFDILWHSHWFWPVYSHLILQHRPWFGLFNVHSHLRPWNVRPYPSSRHCSHLGGYVSTEMLVS